MARLFVDISGSLIKVNLNELWRSDPNYDPKAPKSACLNPKVAQTMLKRFHTQLGAQGSYGGYGENRCDLWKGGYMAKTGAYIHLGMDFNVPAGTAVCAPHLMRVVRVDDDYPEEGGWGTRLIAFVPALNKYLIFAHLGQTLLYQRKGETIVPGEGFGWVGESSHNGGWFPHLHVQTLTEEAWQKHAASDFKELDGYCRPDEFGRLRKECPDPLPLLGEWQ